MRKEAARAEHIRLLRAYRELLAEARRLSEELARWRSIAERVTPPPPGARVTMAGGAGGGRIETAVEHIDTLRESLAARLAALAAQRACIERAIDAVPEARLRLLLQYRYLDGLTWEAIAEKMGLSSQWVHVLHRRALCQLHAEDLRST